MIDISKEIQEAEKQLDIIITVHKKNVSNCSADPDEFDELHETAVENAALLKLIEKQIALNNFNSNGS